MSSTPKVPGYLVQVNDLTGKRRSITRTFIQPILLIARQSAFQYVQELQANQQRHHTIAIQLIEMDRTRLPASNEIICTVFQQQFYQAENQPQPHTMSLGSLWNGLEELDRESDYYQTHGYETGFGCVEMNQIIERNVLAQTQDLSTLTARFFTVLYDGFGYAASLISHFNGQVNDDEILGFCTEFMSAH